MVVVSRAPRGQYPGTVHPLESGHEREALTFGPENVSSAIGAGRSITIPSSRSAARTHPATSLAAKRKMRTAPLGSTVASGRDGPREPLASPAAVAVSMRSHPLPDIARGIDHLPARWPTGSSGDRITAFASGRAPASARSGVGASPTSSPVTGWLPCHAGQAADGAIGTAERIVVGMRGRATRLTSADRRGAGVAKSSRDVSFAADPGRTRDRAAPATSRQHVSDERHRHDPPSGPPRPLAVRRCRPFRCFLLGRRLRRPRTARG